MEKNNSQSKYETPKIQDYGELRELTRTGVTGTQTDVPKGTPVPPFAIFS